MNQPPEHSLKVKHTGLFFLLLALAVVRPDSFLPGIGLPVGPLCLLTAFIILPIRIHSTLGFSNFWMLYRREIVLIAIYQTLCVLSLLYNFDRYGSLLDFFRWGLVFIGGQMLLPLCVFIFLLPEPSGPQSNQLETWKLLGAIFFISVGVLINYYSPELFYYAQKFTVAQELLLHRVPPVSGFFATSTDLGAITGVTLFLLIWLGYLGKKSASLAQRLSLIAITCLTAYSGLLSGSRNFILFMFATVIIASVFFLRRRPALAASAFILCVVIVIALPYILPSTLSHDFGELFPYVKVVTGGGVPELDHYFPEINEATLGKRASLWLGAINLISESPWLGVSNGGFRLADIASPRHNTHNVLLQVLVDSGVLGAIAIGTLATQIYLKNRGNVWWISLIGGIFATLMVDNFSDHSYAWMVATAFCCSLVGAQTQNNDYR